MNELFCQQNNPLSAFSASCTPIPQNSQNLVQSFPESLKITNLYPEENFDLSLPEKLTSQPNFAPQNQSKNHQPTSIASEPHENGTLTDFLTGDDIHEHSPVRRSAQFNTEIYEAVEETGTNNIDALTDYYKWNLDYLKGKITYSFIKSGDSYYNTQPGLAELSNTTKNLVRQVMNDLESIIPVDFVEVPYSSDNPGLMTLMGVDTDWGGYAYSPGGDLTAGDIYLSNNCDFESSWGYKIVSHEVGHALGLKHPGDYSKMGGGGASPFLPDLKDSTDWTVMSYNYGDIPPTDYQSLDVQALQSLYPEIANNTVPAITIKDLTLAEGNRKKIATFQVSLDTPSNQTVKVDFQTVNGSAKASSDYAYKSGILTFLPGKTRKKIRVAVAGDRLSETKEAFSVSLTDPKNAEITDNWGRARIQDND